MGYSGALKRNEAIAFMILTSLRSARNYVQTFEPFEAIFIYEDLLEDENEMSRLFALFGGELIEKNWRKKDSQANTVISQDSLKRFEADSFKTTEDFVTFLQIPRVDSTLNEFKNYIEHG